jgi:nitrilase
VVGVNPCLHVDQIPADFPQRDRLWVADHDDEGWVEAGNSVIIDPTGKILAGPARHE